MGFLRFSLAFAVIIVHCGAFYGMLLPAPIAVQAFFIISGFYMSLILYGGDGAKAKYTSKTLFYSNRILRLYPIYFSFLLLKITLSIIDLNSESPGDQSLALKNLFDGFSFLDLKAFFTIVLSNIFVIGHDILHMFTIDPIEKGLVFTKSFSSHPIRIDHYLLVPQAWSLATEVYFYLLAPFILNRRSHVLLGVIFLSTLLRWYLFKMGFVKDPWNYRIFPLEITFFLLGALSHRLYLVLDKNKYTNKITNTLIGTTILLLTFGYYYLPPEVHNMCLIFLS